MSTINQRMSALMGELQMSTQAFADSIGFTKSTIYNVVGPRGSKPSSEIVSAVLTKYPQFSPNWLLKGEGEMFLTEADKEASAQSVRLRGMKERMRIKSDVIGDISPAYTVSEKDDEEAIPFVPITAEGSYLSGFADAEYMEHLPKFYLPFLGLGAGVYAFQVRGDSMSDRFNNGDVVFGQKVNEFDALRWGEVYVLLCNDGLVVKELRRGPDDKHFTLRSYNEHFDPYEVLKTEVRAMYRYQASISFNSSNPNRGGVINFLKILSDQMADIGNSISNLPQVK